MELDNLFPDVPNPLEGKTCRHCEHRQRWADEFSPKIKQVCGVTSKKIKVTNQACRFYKEEPESA